MYPEPDEDPLLEKEDDIDEDELDGLPNHTPLGIELEDEDEEDEDRDADLAEIIAEQKFGDLDEEDEDEDEEKGDKKPKEEKAKEEEKEPEGEKKEEEGEKKEEPKEEDLLQRTVTLKVNGEERQAKVADVIRDAQKVQAADEKFQEAASQSKAALRIVQAIQKDPLDAYLRLRAKRVGVDKAWRELFDNHITPAVEKELEYQSLPDEARNIMERERALKLREEELQERERDAESKAERDRQRKQVDKLVAAARKQKILTNDDGVNRDILMAVAEIHGRAKAQGQDVTPEEAVQLFVDRQRRFSGAHLGSLSAEELKRLHPELGDKVDEADKKERIAQAKEKRRETSTKRKARSRRDREPRKERGYATDYDEAYRRARRADRQAL
jgi:hypothetical protein